MLTAAGRRYIRQAQRGIFAGEIRALKAGREIPGGSKLLPLRPVRDEEGVLDFMRDFVMPSICHGKPIVSEGS